MVLMYSVGIFDTYSHTSAGVFTVIAHVHSIHTQDALNTRCG